MGALRRGGIPQSAALHRTAAHIHSSPGRSTCLRQTLPLSFVFGPERSLTQFKEVSCPQDTPGPMPPWVPSANPEGPSLRCSLYYLSLQTSLPHAWQPSWMEEYPACQLVPGSGLGQLLSGWLQSRWRVVAGVQTGRVRRHIWEICSYFTHVFGSCSLGIPSPPAPKPCSPRRP